MTLRYPRLLSLAAGIILAAVPSLAANLTVEPMTPSLGSMVQTTATGGALYVPGPVDQLTPALDCPPIECNSFDTSIGYTGGFVFIPPDPWNAVGNAHVVNITNVIIQWRAKSCDAATPQYENSLKGFFAGLVGTLGTECFDPKVVYDQYANRFVVVTLERTNDALGVMTGSRILVAVSKAADPNLGWWRFAINSMLLIAGTNYWADFPGIAIDDKAVYITNNMFSITPPYPGVGSRLWIINKAPTYGGPDNNIAFAVYDAIGAAGGVQTTAMPTHMWGPLPAGTGGNALGTYLVSYSGLNAAGIEAVQFIEVGNPIGVPVFTLAQPSVGNMDSNGGQTDALQLGSATRRLETNDRRAQNAVWRNGQIFLAANCMPPAGDPNAGEATAHWWRFNCPGPAAGITLADQGNAGSEDLGANTWTWFPNVQVDCNLNMAIGFAASNSAIYGGAYYATRMFGDPPGTVGPTCTLQLGLDLYIRTFSTSTTATSRWGDYSGLALCPLDEATFWIYNEYAGIQGTPTTVGTVTEYGRWQTKLGKFHLKQPVSVAITSFDASAKDGIVSLRAAFRSDLGVEVVNVYRGGETGPLARIESVAQGGTDFEFTDKWVTPGATYRYQIGVVDAEGEFYSPVATVSVKALTAALEQNNPNPFNPSTTIRFTVPEPGHVALHVYDANGQLVRTLIDGVRVDGTHDATWDGRDNSGAAVGSGVYFYRLTAGKFSESKKMVLLK
jgi:hypothetical protein